MMKSLLSIIASLIFLCLNSIQASDQPNIIFIFTDDHCKQALSAYDDSRMITPHLDRIAEEGMRFDKCYVTNSICGPSRAVIQTGKHSHLNGFVRNGNSFDGSQVTFPKLLRANGYQTAVIGKWHLKSTPVGFDHYDVLIGQGPYYNPQMRTGKLDGEQRVEENTGYTTDLITQKSLSWLKEARDSEKPFMLMYQHKAPHRNWMPGPKYLTWLDDQEIALPDTFFDDWSGKATPASRQTMTVAKHMNQHDLKLQLSKRHVQFTPEQRAAWNAAYEPKNRAFLEKRASMTDREIALWQYQRYVKDYLRCVKSVDDGVGEILDFLDESGLAANTVVIYSSDQGWFLGEHGWYDKRWMYEESLVTPLLVRWPGVTKPGSINDQHIVSNLDFAQTFLGIAGVEADPSMQGASLVPLLKGQSPEGWRESFYYHFYEFPAVHSVARHHGVTNGQHKLIQYYGPSHVKGEQYDEWELFDLQKDPDELTNVYDAPAYNEIQQAMHAELDKLMENYQVPPLDRGPEVPSFP